MEIVQFAWSPLSLSGCPQPSSTSLATRERRQTAIEIRSPLEFRQGILLSLGPPSRFSDRFVESGFEFRSGLRNPRVGTHARNAIVFGRPVILNSIPAYREHANRRRRDWKDLPVFHLPPAPRLATDPPPAHCLSRFSIFRASARQRRHSSGMQAHFLFFF